MIRAVRWLMVVALMVAGGSPAAAEPKSRQERAASHADRGDDAIRAGDYRQAIDHYRRARAIEDRPKFRCNIGGAYYKLGDWPRTHLFLGLCLADSATLEARKVKSFSEAYAFAEAKMKEEGYARLAVHTSPPTDARVSVATLDEIEFEAPRVIWLPPGEHVITARADGYQEGRRRVKAERGGNLKVVVSLTEQPIEQPLRPDFGTRPDPTALERPDGAAGGGVGASSTGPMSSDPSAVPRDRSSRSRAWIGFAAGGVALAGGAVFHAMAVGTRSDLEQLPSGAERRDAIDELKLERNLMFGLYGAGAVATGIGVYLWLRADRARPTSGAYIGPRGAGIWASF